MHAFSHIIFMRFHKLFFRAFLSRLLIDASRFCHIDVPYTYNTLTKEGLTGSVASPYSEVPSVVIRVV